MRIIKRLLKPIDNYSWEGNDAESVVNHTTGGTTVEGAINTLKARGLSYHFIVHTDGKIYQLVDFQRSAWHSGVVDKMTAKAKVFYQGENPNNKSVGVAFTQSSALWAGELTEKQAASGVWLTKHIGSENLKRYNSSNMFGHKEVTSYKPQESIDHKLEIQNGLVGDKDDKDVVRSKRWLTLQLQVLRLQLKVLRLKLWRS